MVNVLRAGALRHVLDIDDDVVVCGLARGVVRRARERVVRSETLGIKDFDIVVCGCNLIVRRGVVINTRE